MLRAENGSDKRNMCFFNVSPKLSWVDCGKAVTVEENRGRSHSGHVFVLICQCWSEVMLVSSINHSQLRNDLYRESEW